MSRLTEACRRSGCSLVFGDGRSVAVQRAMARCAPRPHPSLGVAAAEFQLHPQVHSGLLHYSEIDMLLAYFIYARLEVQDFIATITSGSTVAFIVVTNAANLSSSSLWKRVARMGSIFRTSYVLVTIASEDENTAFHDAYFKFMESDNTPILQIQDTTMAGEMMMALATGHAELSRQDRSTYEKLEREKFISTDEAYVTAITSIWGLDTHDANSLLAGIGCIQDVSNATEEEILRKTDLSVEKARTIVTFFNRNASQHAPRCD